MSFTIKVIFLGLIGFVPSSEGKKNISALLVDPIRAVDPWKHTPVQEHLPMVFLLHGHCDESGGGSCYRISPRRAEDAKRLRLDRILQQRPGLLWMLEDEDLDISGDEDERLKLRNSLLRFIWKVSPRFDLQSKDFSWVPRLNELTSGRGQIREGCRHGDARCAIHAHFRIQGGAAGACHMFHDSEDPEKPQVKIFNYSTANGQPPLRRAVADAMQVEFEESGGSVILRSRILPGGEGGGVAWAKLTPDSAGKLTLVVANLSELQDGEAEHDGYTPSHSDAFFDLLADPEVPRPTRQLDEKEEVNVDPGPCEEEMSEIASLFLGDDSKRELPHTVTACDGASYPKPRQ